VRRRKRTSTLRGTSKRALPSGEDRASATKSPWATPRGDFVALALSSPDGNALFEVPRSVLVRFLRRTYVAVPRGRETDYLDLDAAVIRLLAGR